MKRSFLQEIIEKTVQILLSSLKIILYSKWRLERPKSNNLNKKAIILANGPSLKSFIDNKKKFFFGYDLCGVNFFWKSDFFTVLKPKHYVIASTNFWAQGMIDKNDKERKITFVKLAEKVSWPMNLYVPYFAQKHKRWQESIALNSNIKIYFFNLVPLEGPSCFINWAMKRGLAMPRPHNVLIPAIKITIDLLYSEVYIAGADHSWLKEIFVTEDNNAYLTQKHFYDENEAKPEVMYSGPTTKKRKLHEMLMKFVYAFSSYHTLNEYAKSRDVKIYNTTEGSYIDAFERKQI